MDLYEIGAVAVELLKKRYAEANADGKITAAEAFQLFAFGIQEFVQAASGLTLSGPEKKAAVMAAVDKLYDTLLAPIDVPYIPEIVERTVVDPAVKKLVLIAADGLIEFFVARLAPQG